MVGVDGSEGSRRALRWAIAEADRRDAQIEAVGVWQSPYDLREEMYFPVDERAMEEKTREHLTTAVAAEGERASVPIESVVLEGDPAKVLCERSATADLLVVGSRGRGGFGGLLLGSVTTKCVHHCRCPVVIVPEDNGWSL